MRRSSKLILGALLIISVGLVIQRDGVNLARYHTPVPDCHDVLSIEQCKMYGPWGRNYSYAQQKSPTFHASPVRFTGNWFFGMWYRLFFAINGARSYFMNYPPLPLPSMAALALAVIGGAVVLVYAWQIFRQQPFLLLLLTIIVVYCLALWVDTFQQYMQTGRPVAINGRYLVPILLLVAAIMGRSFSLALTKWPKAKLALALTAILLFASGGGIANFIVRSDPSWNWPNDTVISLNNTARRLIAPLIIEGERNKAYWR